MKRPWLMPLAPLYAAGLRWREIRLERGWEKVRRLKYPVISIGNISAGGTGKTPLTIALARMLSASGFSVDVLSRGYGRKSREPARVKPDGSWEQFGDEPLLIAREAKVPVYVAAERADAGRLAEADGSAADIVDGRQIGDAASPRRVHILDDGFQHRQLARNIDIVLIDREDWHDHLLPAGNLREPLRSLERASVIAMPARDEGFEAELLSWGWTGPIWRVRRRMDVPQVDSPVASFCGIARPQQFFAGLEAGGLSLATRISFEDHHRYTRSDVERLVAQARRAEASVLITTEKDKVRLGGLTSAFPASLPLKTAHLQSELEDEQAVLSWLQQKMAACSGNRDQQPV